jgi:hypothetical protein
MAIWLKVWEEPSLERGFGQGYRDYRHQTPFLVPRFKPLIINLAASLLHIFLHEEKDPPEEETVIFGK